jgi:hypothetical protein
MLVFNNISEVLNYRGHEEVALELLAYNMSAAEDEDLIIIYAKNKQELKAVEGMVGIPYAWDQIADRPQPGIIPPNYTGWEWRLRWYDKTTKNTKSTLVLYHVGSLL